MRKLIATMTALMSLAGCSQMSAADSSPEARCQIFARQEGLAVERIEGVDLVGSGHNVRLRLVDGLGRQFNATCATVEGPRWTQPLPSNVVRSNDLLRK